MRANHAIQCNAKDQRTGADPEVQFTQSLHEQPQQVCGERCFRLPTSRGTWMNCRETSRWSLPGNGEGGGAGLVESAFEDTEGQFKKHLLTIWRVATEFMESDSSQEQHMIGTGTKSGLRDSCWISGESSSWKKWAGCSERLWDLPQGCFQDLGMQSHHSADLVLAGVQAEVELDQTTSRSTSQPAFQWFYGALQLGFPAPEVLIYIPPSTLSWVWFISSQYFHNEWIKNTWKIPPKNTNKPQDTLNC